MNWFDYALLALLTAFVIEGLVRGFSRLAIGLAATILGILLAAWFYGVAAGYLKPWIENPAMARIAGFLLILVGVQVAGGLLAWAVAKLFKTAGLGWLDRLLGAGFGALKAVLVGIAVALVFSAFPVKKGAAPETLAESRFAPYLAEAAMVLSYATPNELKAGFARTYEDLQALWRKHAPPGLPGLETKAF